MAYHKGNRYYERTNAAIADMTRHDTLNNDDTLNNENTINVTIIITILTYARKHRTHSVDTQWARYN